MTSPEHGESYTTFELRERATRGALWGGVGAVLSGPISLLATIVLARILVPADFGLMLMATSVLGVATVLNEFGLGVALVQRETLTDGMIQSIFWLNMAIGVAILAAAVAAAPAIAAFYHQPRLVPIVAALSTIFIISSFELVPRSLLFRKMSFRRISVASLAAGGVYAAVAIAAALFGLGVWSLVIGRIASATASMLVIATGIAWQPRLRFRLSEVRHVAEFAGLLTVSSVLAYGWQNIDYILTGKFLSRSSLGLYGIAFTLMMAPASRVSQLVARAALPGFSAIQSDRDRLGRAYVAVISYVAVVLGPVFATAGVLSNELIVSLYGPRWAAAAAPFMFLCVSGYVLGVTSLVGLVTRPLGRADVDVAYAGIILAGVATGAALGLPHGILGVAVGVTIANTVVRVPMMLHAASLVRVRVSTLLGALAPSLFGAAVAAGVAALVRLPLQAIGSPLLATAAVCGLAALAASWAVTRATPLGRPVREVERLLGQALSARRASRAADPEAGS